MTLRDRIANFYLRVYALDAGLSATEVLLRYNFGFEGLMLVRESVAMVVVLATLMFVPVLWLSAAFPARLFLPLMISVFWFMAPVPLFPVLEPRSLDITSVLLQVAFAFTAYSWVRGRNSGESGRNSGASWTFDEGTWPIRRAGVGYWLMSSATLLFFAFIGFGFFASTLMMVALEDQTGEFLRFDEQGIALADRHYRKGADEIRLVGMMHIGEGDAYRVLYDSFVPDDVAERAATVILAEGVSDQQELIGDDGLGQADLAQSLGLQAQRSIRDYIEAKVDAVDETEAGGAEAGEARDGDGDGGEAAEAPAGSAEAPADAPDVEENLPAPAARPEVRSADLDFADLSEETRRFIQEVGDGVRGLRGATRAELVSFFLSISENEWDWKKIQGDILEKRNAHLLAELDGALEEFDRIIVPWGAYHMPQIEAAVLERGFRQTRASYYPIASWRTLAGLGVASAASEEATSDN